MSFYGFFLVLLAACCHATWNFCVKKINGGPELIWLFSLCSIIIYLPIAFIIVGTNPVPVEPRTLFFIVGSILLHTAYFLLLQYGYRKGDLSVVYPIARATGPMLSTTSRTRWIAYHFFCQPVNVRQYRAKKQFSAIPVAWSGCRNINRRVHGMGCLHSLSIAIPSSAFRLRRKFWTMCAVNTFGNKKKRANQHTMEAA